MRRYLNNKLLLELDVKKEEVRRAARPQPLTWNPQSVHMAALIISIAKRKIITVKVFPDD